MRRSLLPFLIALCFVARPCRAQEIRGTVTESATGLPVRGAVVLLLDSSGATLARALTGETGRYSMSIGTRAESRRIRVLRLGFRPRDLDVPAANRVKVVVPSS